MLQLKQADKSCKELFRNIFNMYQNELSQYFEEYQTVDEKGYFDYNAVDVYFEGNEAVIPYVIMADENVAGIVVLSKAPFTKEGCDYCIQELFLIGFYRGKGVAESCLGMLFQQHKGKYCLSVLSKNQRAISFWNKVCAKYGQGLSKQENSVDRVLEFTV